MRGEPAIDFWRGHAVTVTGGAGFVGRAVVAALRALEVEPRVIRSAEHDLRHAGAAREALDGADIVIHLAATVGGIGFNRRNPGVLAHDNLLMAANVFEQSRLARVGQLVAAGTVCAYPRLTPVPFSERDLWAGYPEETNAPYGIAKKTMVVLSDAYRQQYGFRSCVPIVTNTYGPGDNFDLDDSHVIPAVIRRFLEARDAGAETVELWGSGRPSREFVYVDDVARALLLAAEHLDTSEPVNIGTGIETPIRELAELVARITGYEGQVAWDTTQPDGQPSRCLDVSLARELLGFEARTTLEDGLRRTVASLVRAPAGS